MVTEILPQQSPDSVEPAAEEAMDHTATRAARDSSLPQAVRKFLLPLASLKFTVALFGMAIFIVLAGTFAQWEKDINQVIDEFFRVKFHSSGSWSDLFSTMFVKIDFRIFFPPSFFPNPPHVPGGFYFPKGWLIGALMAVNLLAAHTLRFKTQAKGPRLFAGLGVLALGILATWVVIGSGSSPDGLQNEPLVAWSTLWQIFSVSLKIGLGLGALGLAAAAYSQWESRPILRWIAVAAAALMVSVDVWFIARGEAATLNDSSMRILWMLIKATLSSLVLLAGCVLVFRKRGGIVLLHAGVGLLMFNELLVGTTHHEAQMIIEEGETVNYVQNINALEVAIVDRSDSKEDRVVAVPLQRLTPEVTLADSQLPFKIELLKLIPNARLAEVESDEENLATTGAGKTYVAKPIAAGTGTDTGGQVDLSAAYVKLTGLGGEDLGTHLLALELTFGKVEDKVRVGDKTYEVSLRFERSYKPYSIHLIDLRKDDYVGTSTVKNYASDIRLVDNDRHVDRELSIWMNNPLRFAGETFYQSNYHFDPRTAVETTTLQVVQNNGWMIPYVSCMIVVVGLLAQFGLSLARFLRRREQEQAAATLASASGQIESGKQRGKKGTKQSSPELATAENRRFSFAGIFPYLVAGCFGLYLASSLVPHESKSGEMDLKAVGQLPLAYEGRVKPLDTLARTTLRQISGKQTMKDENGDRQPAIRWLLDLAVDTKKALEYKVFRIDNPDLLQTLKLEPRAGYLYSFSEFSDQFGELMKQARLAHEQEAAKKGSTNTFQRKVLELEKRIGIVDLLVESLHQPIMTQDEIQQSVSRAQKLMQREPPLLIPPFSAEEQKENHWQAFPIAVLMGTMQEAMTGEKMSPATSGYLKIFEAYAKNQPGSFNAAVADYQAALDKHANTEFDLAHTTYEAAFNKSEPFYHAMLVYGFAFLLSAIAWLGWSRPLNRAAYWTMVITLLYHTWALYARMHISGRPPVTNLYSSAIFIGWGCVVIGLIFETIFRMGIGNIVASATGFGSLMVAHMLTTMVPDHMGDTMIVMQAVLDTQFWLATHVVCITMGYATTFLAGFLGVLYILLGVLTPSFRNNPEAGKVFTRMTYGTLCFALLFSFFGTVLGGLWADDSWGRFWGWDPKENGALIIVLWNALVLHARWDGMVKDRGLAVLAAGGNIATAWSWFGVNELGVGMHSYGFTAGVLLVLIVFVVSQLAIIGLGLIPREYWVSFGKRAYAPIPNSRMKR
jgi:ABC-type transport system involved in cytochrome c biogenesis permease subunit